MHFMQLEAETEIHMIETQLPDGHNQRQWAQVRKRAILQQTTIDDWENANDWQQQVMHQIELAIISVTDDHDSSNSNSPA